MVPRCKPVASRCLALRRGITAAAAVGVDVDVVVAVAVAVNAENIC